MRKVSNSLRSNCRNAMKTYPELTHEKSNVLVEGVKYNFTDAVITPRAMYEQQLSQITKLANGNIGATGSL